MREFPLPKEMTVREIRSGLDVRRKILDGDRS